MIEKQTIFITGAASGIGRATAQAFARLGWFVGAFDIDERGLESLGEELGPDKAMYAKLDVSDRTAVLGCMDLFKMRTEGRLDILFSNAGIDAKGPFADTPWEKIVQVLDVNLTGSLAVIHAAIPLLRATPGSLCLSTASASAIFGTAGLAVYSASKHAVRGLTEALSVELASDGVRVADLLPGIIDTGMLPAETKAMLPSEGILAPLSPEKVADAVWMAYNGDQLHWYIPEDLKALDVECTTTPEAVRDRRIAGSII